MGFFVKWFAACFFLIWNFVWSTISSFISSIWLSSYAQINPTLLRFKCGFFIHICIHLLNKVSIQGLNKQEAKHVCVCRSNNIESCLNEWQNGHEVIQCDQVWLSTFLFDDHLLLKSALKLSTRKEIDFRFQLIMFLKTTFLHRWPNWSNSILGTWESFLSNWCTNKFTNVTNWQVHTKRQPTG